MDKEMQKLERLVALTGPYRIEKSENGTCKTEISDGNSESITIISNGTCQGFSNACETALKGFDKNDESFLKFRLMILSVDAKRIENLTFAEIHFKNTETDVNKAAEKRDKFNEIAVPKNFNTLIDVKDGTEYYYDGRVSGYNGDAYIKGFFEPNGLRKLRETVEKINKLGYKTGKLFIDVNKPLNLTPDFKKGKENELKK